ncbi:MAG TPA: hypothetical protein VKO18_20590 [Terriglobia bacterium]|nr:hypothetical protein [Terriglobia bacterium]
MRFRHAIVDAYVRSTLECGGSTPPWHHTKEEYKGGVEPPHSKVLRTVMKLVRILHHGKAERHPRPEAQ